jgi:hypothetical protein
MLGCPGRVDEPTDDTGTTTSTGSDPTTQTPTTQTTTTQTTTTSSAESSSTGPFELPDCSQHSFVAECDNEPGCVWRIADGGCVIECAEVPDLETCVGFAHCVWTDQCGYPGPI